MGAGQQRHDNVASVVQIGLPWQLRPRLRIYPAV